MIGETMSTRFVCALTLGASLGCAAPAPTATTPPPPPAPAPAAAPAAAPEAAPTAAPDPAPAAVAPEPKPQPATPNDYSLAENWLCLPDHKGACDVDQDAT